MRRVWYELLQPNGSFHQRPGCGMVWVHIESLPSVLLLMRRLSFPLSLYYKVWALRLDVVRLRNINIKVFYRDIDLHIGTASLVTLAVW